MYSPLRRVFAEKYLAALAKMENLALSLVSKIEGCGLKLPVKGAWLRDSAVVDSLKFFLKQQQKALEDGQGVVCVCACVCPSPK